MLIFLKVPDPGWECEINKSEKKCQFIKRYSEIQ